MLFFVYFYYQIVLITERSPEALRGTEADRLYKKISELCSEALRGTEADRLRVTLVTPIISPNKTT